MGLFGGNFTKEGPGVSKNELEKNRFFLFFDILGRKIGKLITLNLIYLITLIPFIAGILFSVRINPLMLININHESISSLPLFVFTCDIVGIILIIISIFVLGPATCGLTYVVRNMQRQEHTWVFSDFREHFAKNFKQGIIMSVIDILGVFLLYTAFCFYTYTMPQGQLIATISKYIIISFSIVFLMMHYYIYTMIVTFDMKMKDILKNAVIFAIAKLPLNIFITIVLALIIGLSIWYLAIGGLCAIFITLSFMGLFIVYCTYPTIERAMMPSKEEIDEEKERDFQDAQ